MIRNLDEKFGTWAGKIQPLFPLLEPILEELQALSKRGKKIYPTSDQTFRAFQETDFNNLKAVVLGISPYHTCTKEKVVIADGIALSCSNTNKEQPSLEKWYDALQKEYPQEVIIRNTDLTYLCKEGILMLNIALTVEAMKPLSHNDLWQPFIKALFTDVISLTGVPIVLLGKEAKIADKWRNAFQWCFKVDHPASAAHSQTDWDSEGFFKNVAKIVKDNNGHDLKWFKQPLIENEDDLPF
jgi:uracil-DNA glycosylase